MDNLDLGNKSAWWTLARTESVAGPLAPLISRGSMCKYVCSEWMFLPPAFAQESVGEHAPELFAGYKRYSRRGVGTGGIAWCGSTGRWRKEAMEDLRREEASCFFRAMAWVLPQHAWNGFYLDAHAIHEGVQRGVTPHDAFITVRVANLPIDLAYVGADGHIRVYHRSAAPVRRGLLWVPLNDAHEWAPHWLPWTSLHVREHVRWTFADLDTMAPDGNPRAEIPPAMVAPLLAARHAADRRPPPPVHRAVGPHGPPIAYGYVCVNTPPVDAPGVQRQNDIRAALDAKTKYFAPKIWTTSKDINVTGCDLRKGSKPTAFSRFKAHALPLSWGFLQGIIWELHPDVLLSADISEGDYVFHQVNVEDNPRDPRFNYLGQCIPERLSSIVTRGGTLWSLTDERNYTLCGREYAIYRLVMTNASDLLDLFTSSSSIITSHVVSLQHNAVEETFPAISNFPTPQAYVRACYDQLAKLINPELVGTLMMCRNEELARDELSGLLPMDVARDLERLHRELQRMWRTAGNAVLPFVIRSPSA